MKLLDIFILLLLIWGGYSGYKSGLIVEFFSLISFSIAKVVSIKLLHLFKIVYTKWYDNYNLITSYLIFGLFFIIIWGIIMLLGKIFRSKIKKTTLAKADQIVGCLVGTSKWGFYISTAIWLANLVGINLPDSYLTDTLIYPIIKVLSPTFISWLSNWLPTLEKSLEIIEHIR